MNVWLAALIFLLGAATMFVGRDVFDVIRKTGCASDVDLTRAAARGELLHLDWGDARVSTGENIALTTTIAGPILWGDARVSTGENIALTTTIAGPILAETFDRARHLAAVKDEPA